MLTKTSRMTSTDNNGPSLNASSHGSHGDTPPTMATAPSHIWTASVATPLTIIALLTVVGNLLLILSYAKDTRIRASVGNVYVLNRAIADTIIGLIVIPFGTASLVLEQWPFSQVACQIWTVIESSATLVSVLSLFLISLDRYWLVTKKLRYQKFQTQKRALFLIFCCWTICVTFYAVIVFAWDSFTHQQETPVMLLQECRLQARNNVYLALILFLLEFLLPLILIAGLNRVVYGRIRARSKSFVHSQPSASLAASAAAARSRKESAQETTNRAPDLSGSNGNVTRKFTIKANSNLASELHQGEAVHTEAVTNVSLISIRTFPSEDFVTSTTCIATDHRDMDSTDRSSSPSSAVTTETIANNTPSSEGESSADTVAIAPTPRKTTRQLSVILEPPRINPKSARTNRHRKAGITLGVLVCVYVVCWFPNCLVVLVNAACGGCIPRTIVLITTYLHWCISTINPYLYAVLNDKFRAAFGRLLYTAKCAKKKHIGRKIQNLTGSATGSEFVQSKMNVK